MLEFDNNTAQIGGAIFVDDHSNTNICIEENYGTCFIQLPSFASSPWNGAIEINSPNGNTTIYGGLLDRCMAKHKYTNSEQKMGIDYLRNVTQINTAMLEDLITSGPVRVCYCKEGKVDCNYIHPTLSIKRGETFKVEVAAVDQVNHTVDVSILIKSTHRLGME